MLIMLVLALAACKSKKVVVTTPEGEVEMLSAKAAKKALEEKPSAPSWVRIKADISVDQNGSNNSGVAELRMRQDSILWVEIADPIIGFKAIRAFAMSDTVAYINRLDKTYFAGSYNYVEKKLGTGIPFPFIFKVFQGRLFSTEQRPEIRENRYVIEEKYDDGNSYFAQVEPRYLDCVTQEYYTAKDWIKISYSDYKVVRGNRFPHKISVQVFGTQNLTATFTVRELETSGPFKTPFKVSSKYERVD
jgi:rRNA maturation endonuclease Nob1